jgi:hypothetical protein
VEEEETSEMPEIVENCEEKEGKDEEEEKKDEEGANEEETDDATKEEQQRDEENMEMVRLSPSLYAIGESKRKTHQAAVRGRGEKEGDRSVEM